MAQRTFRDRLIAKYQPDPTTGCWLWAAAKNAYGYGVIGGPDYATRRTLLAHRAMYVEFVGPIPEGMDLDHLCRTRACVNPAHLEPVTRRTNLLRGETVTARHAATTHCPAGHPYFGRNLMLRGGNPNRRVCRACHQARKRKAAIT